MAEIFDVQILQAYILVQSSQYYKISMHGTHLLLLETK